MIGKLGIDFSSSAIFFQADLFSEPIFSKNRKFRDWWLNWLDWMSDRIRSGW